MDYLIGMLLLFALYMAIKIGSIALPVYFAIKAAEKTRNRYGKGALRQIAVGAFVLVALLALPRYTGIRDHIVMRSVQGECTWKIASTVSDVEGVFMDSAMPHERELLRSIYPFAEYKDENNRYIRSNTLRKWHESATRTYRYGVRFTHTKVTSRIQRTQYAVTDFDTNTVLSTYQEYRVALPPEDPIWHAVVGPFDYRPKSCGSIGEWSAGLRNVLRVRTPP